MKIKTIEGFVIIDPTEIRQIQYRDFGNKNYQVEITYNDSMGMNYAFMMSSEEKAMEAIEQIQSGMVKAEVIVEEGYIDGFKAGVEYALRVGNE